MHRNTEELRRAKRIERVVLAVNRSDYMLDEPSNTLLQVPIISIDIIQCIFVMVHLPSTTRLHAG